MKIGNWCSSGAAFLLLTGCAKPPAPVAARSGTAVPAGPNYPAPQPERSGRAPVQHGIDPGAASVNRTPEKITVEQLVAMRKKVGDKIELSSYPTKRIAPFETSSFQIDATIKSIKHEKDGDFYFVLKGDSGAEAVVEVPDPSLCKGSPFLSDIVKARQTLYNKFHPSDTAEVVNTRATITGVGYLGSHKRKGSGSFGAAARLMPGTGVNFDAAP
jgi:hypothetical protein